MINVDSVTVARQLSAGCSVVSLAWFLAYRRARTRAAQWRSFGLFAFFGVASTWLFSFAGASAVVLGDNASSAWWYRWGWLISDSLYVAVLACAALLLYRRLRRR